MPPEGAGSVIFSDADDGDLRSDPDARLALSRKVGINPEWATMHQVHGSAVVEVSHPGPAGEADALWTSVTALPLAVFTADCFPVVLQTSTAVGIAHAGWRGTAGGVVAALRTAMGEAGFAPQRAFVGPGIGPCCFEVGDEVARQFPENAAQTTWGARSVDLVGSIRAQVAGIEVWSGGVCTMHDRGWFSHRSNGTPRRQAALAWV